MELKLKDLRYLVAVADQRHFGRAAARCFVSQPTLSAQLKKLEQALGVQLIERAPNAVSLTAVGEEIVARARRGTPEMPLVGDGHEVAQVLELQLHGLGGYTASIEFIKSIDWNHSRCGLRMTGTCGAACAVPILRSPFA